MKPATITTTTDTSDYVATDGAKAPCVATIDPRPPFLRRTLGRRAMRPWVNCSTVCGVLR